MGFVKLFRHNDLDGVSSNTIACKVFSKLGYNLSTEKCDYTDVDKNILGFINSREYTEDAIIFIADISPSYETALILDRLPNKKIHIDHHDSAAKDYCRKDPNKNDFTWSYIREGDSATLLVYKYFLNSCANKPELYDIVKSYENLAFYTDLWDTKHDVPEYEANLTKINEMKDLMSALGTENFKARFMNNPSTDLTEVEMAMINAVAKVKNNVVRYTKTYNLTTTVRGETVLYGVCFCSTYKSDVAEYAFEMNKDLLLMIIIDMDGCSGSLRRNGSHRFGDVDLIEVAKQFDANAGGHPFACAFNFTIENYSKIIDKALTGNFTVK